MKRRTLLMFGLPAAAVAALMAYGIAKRELALTALQHVSTEQAALPVEIITPQPGPSTRPLVLPGTVRAWYEAPIFGQVAGYVHRWNEDFGATVKAGQLLATIDTPGLDAQYAAAKANLDVAQANYRLAVSTAARWQALAGTVAVSKQEVDVQVAGAAARKAELEEVATQNVARYAALEAFKRARLRSEGQIASGLDLARALSQLDSAQAQESETALQRDLMQHAVAVLVGAMPSAFSIAPVGELRLIPPQLPPGVPSELLQRRPDIASAERQMASANASIGVSRAAFYPHVIFGGTAGFQDSAFNLLSLPNSLWSVGAGAMLPLIDGGLRRAQLRRSWSQYAQMRDNYRGTVLAAFQEVEDGLSLTQRLATEVTQEREASDQATQALSISTLLYEDGIDNYLSVSVAQVQALAAQTAEVQVRVRQMQAAVSLIRALGGGWTEQALPSEEQTLQFGAIDYGASAKE